MRIDDAFTAAIVFDAFVGISPVDATFLATLRTAAIRARKMTAGTVLLQTITSIELIVAITAAFIEQTFFG